MTQPKTGVGTGGVWLAQPLGSVVIIARGTAYMQPKTLSGKPC